MKKAKIIFLNLLIIFYVLTIGGWWYENEILFFVSFGCFSLSLLVFIILAMKKASKTDDKEYEDIPNINYDEAYATDTQEEAAYADVSQSEAAVTDAYGEAVLTDAAQDTASDTYDESSASDVGSYMSRIDELEFELQDTKDMLENYKSELEAYKERENSQKNNFMSILPEGITPREALSTVNIVDVARSVVEELHTAALRAGLRVQVSSGEEQILVRADEDLLRVLFRNIVDNSIKYMNRQGILVITLSTIGDDLFVVLKDNGEGLSSEETNHIFELNYQGSNRISGNGLGLAQAKAVVEYYGGNIYAKSTMGGGMGIYIQLPTT
ncbi:MAG: HAMP domain-containing histidine kinase [Lachnospiraceae bacterium]|nr:HAMP domain-containing histidine kinase [Lachnospiraceae bacterium]